MKTLHVVLILGLCGVAFAKAVESETPADATAVESDRKGRAMGDDDDFSADFDEFVRYFQRGIMKFINKMTGLQERQTLGNFVPRVIDQIQRGIRRFINRMTNPEERQSFGDTIPFIGRFIFRSLSYLGSFLVGALAVPPLLAGNALSLFGLYSPSQPNDLIASPVLPSLQFNGLNNRNTVDRNSAASPQKVNDLSEALFLLGQKNQAVQQDSNQAEALLAQAAGSSSPVEISEIVNDLIRVQSNTRPASLWDRLTSGLSVFLPQVSRQVTPAGALGSLLFLGTLVGAPYFLNRRSDSGLFGGEDYSNDEAVDSSEDYLQPPSVNYGPTKFESGKPNKRAKKTDEAEIYDAQASSYNAYQQAPAFSGDQAYAAAGQNSAVYAQPGALPYAYVSRRSGETKSEKAEAAPAQAA